MKRDAAPTSLMPWSVFSITCSKVFVVGLGEGPPSRSPPTIRSRSFSWPGPAGSASSTSELTVVVTPASALTVVKRAVSPGGTANTMRRGAALRSAPAVQYVAQVPTSPRLSTIVAGLSVAQIGAAGTFAVKTSHRIFRTAAPSAPPRMPISGPISRIERPAIACYRRAAGSEAADGRTRHDRVHRRLGAYEIR